MINYLNLCIFCAILLVANSSLTKKLLIVSMDGFRHDYPKLAKTPTLNKIASQGIKAEYMTPPFVTKTFPTHYTLVTGLFEEKHGIVDNRMYDPKLNESFSMQNIQTKWWNATEPIWITVVRQKKKSGCMFWPGSETKINNFTATYFKKYQVDYPYDDRITTVINWFKNDNVDFATLYFNQPDKNGHKYGPNSTETLSEVEKMDGIIAKLLDQMEKNGLRNKVNVIITSDHGMSELSPSRTIPLPPLYSNMTFLKYPIFCGPYCAIWPKNNEAKKKFFSEFNMQNAKIYSKETFPLRWHYKNNDRIPPMLILADDGWFIKTTKNTRLSKGTHGYDNKHMSMKTIFYAIGPNIKKMSKIPPFDSVHVYPFMCKLLDLKCEKRDGNETVLSKYITSNSDRVVMKYYIFFFMIFVTIFLNIS